MSNAKATSSATEAARDAAQNAAFKDKNTTLKKEEEAESNTSKGRKRQAQKTATNMADGRKVAGVKKSKNDDRATCIPSADDADGSDVEDGTDMTRECAPATSLAEEADPDSGTSNKNKHGAQETGTNKTDGRKAAGVKKSKNEDLAKYNAKLAKYIPMGDDDSELPVWTRGKSAPPRLCPKDGASKKRKRRAQQSGKNKADGRTAAGGKVDDPLVFSSDDDEEGTDSEDERCPITRWLKYSRCNSV